MRNLFRILAVLLAIFILGRVLVDLMNVLLHSPRLITSLLYRDYIPLVAGILLLVPPKMVKSGVNGVFYLIALFAVNCWYSLVWMQAFGAIFRGHMNMRAIAAGLLMMAILWGTFWMAASQYSSGSGKKRKS